LLIKFNQNFIVSVNFINGIDLFKYFVIIKVIGFTMKLAHLNHNPCSQKFKYNLNIIFNIIFNIIL